MTDSNYSEVDALKEARTWHHDQHQDSVRWARTGWILAMGLGGALALSLLALVSLIPLRRTEVITVFRDPKTGLVEGTSTWASARFAEDDAVVKGNLTRFVGARERYDPRDLQSDVDLVAAFAAPAVWTPYNALYTPGAEGNLRDRYGRQTNVSVFIKSISIVEKGRALVRFSTQRSVDQGSPIEEHWVSSVSYEFVQPPAEVRGLELNPVGFYVTAYRKDQEVIHESKN